MAMIPPIAPHVSVMLCNCSLQRISCHYSLTRSKKFSLLVNQIEESTVSSTISVVFYCYKNWKNSSRSQIFSLLEFSPPCTWVEFSQKSVLVSRTIMHCWEFCFKALISYRNIFTEFNLATISHLYSCTSVILPSVCKLFSKIHIIPL